MGNPLKKVLPWIDPIGNQGAKAIANTTGLGASPKAPNAPPGYDPSKNPGAHLFSPPPGGPPGAGGPSSSLFGGGSNPGGSTYAPNFWETRPGSIGSGQQPSSRIGVPGVGVNPNVNPFRGGVGMPPATATGGQGMPPGGPTNPQLQQQMAIAQMLRNGQAGQPPTMATHQ